jgi:hypothetical protein
MKRSLLNAAIMSALASSTAAVELHRNEGPNIGMSFTRPMKGASGSPKRNQERASRALAQRSRQINRMRGK